MQQLPLFTKPPFCLEEGFFYLCKLTLLNIHLEQAKCDKAHEDCC